MTTATRRPVGIARRAPLPQVRRSTPHHAGRGAPHQWVAAAIVGVGVGSLDRRAEHAARTGRYVVPVATRIDVLEVYCLHCRVPYRPEVASSPCPESHSHRAASG